MLTIIKKKKKAEADLAKYKNYAVLLFSPLKVHSLSEKGHPDEVSCKVLKDVKSVF